MKEITKRYDGTEGYVERMSYHWRVRYLLQASEADIADYLSQAVGFLNTLKILTIECPECGAKPSRWCRGKNGRIMGAVHAARYDARPALITKLEIVDLHPDDL